MKIILAETNAYKMYVQTIGDKINYVTETLGNDFPFTAEEAQAIYDLGADMEFEGGWDVAEGSLDELLAGCEILCEVGE